MNIPLNPILERFAERTPIPVMARGVLERCLSAQQLDAWFETVAEARYTRELLFSSVFDVMTDVVFRQQSSVHAAHQVREETIGVSVTSLYNKLNGLESGISAELVRFAADEAAALIEELGGAKPALLPGWRVKVLDGNCLEGREHRLKAFDYLIALQRHADAVKNQPERWLPWNYQATVEAEKKAA